MAQTAEERASYMRKWRSRNPEKAKAKDRDYYQRNKEKVKASNRDYRSRNLEKVQATKHERRDLIRNLKAKPCVDCGGLFHFSAMDFDHVFGEKLFGIGTSGARTLKSILAEIEKCDLVCSNCHRVRTWKRKTGISNDSNEHLQ